MKSTIPSRSHPKYFLMALYLMALTIIMACQMSGQLFHRRMLEPDDKINGIKLTTNTAGAFPVLAFCSLAQEANHVSTLDCNIPPEISKIAIGYIFVLTDRTFASLDWSQFAWKLQLDGEPINLKAFGTFDFTAPTLTKGFGPVREVFIQQEIWDVVIVKLKPGTHSLLGMAESESDTYTWNVNLVLNAPQQIRHASLKTHRS